MWRRRGGVVVGGASLRHNIDCTRSSYRLPTHDYHWVCLDRISRGVDTMNHADISVSDSLIVFGGSRFIRAVVGPFGDLADYLSREPEALVVADTDKTLWEVSSHPQAYLTAFQGFIGICAFMGSWLATTALNELYELKIRPAIREMLGGIEFSGTRVYGVSLCSCHLPTQTRLMLVALGKTAAEVSRAEQLIPTVLYHASKWAEQNISAPKVHLYKIEGESFSNLPELYPDVISALKSLASAFPLRPPNFIRHDG